MDIGEIYMEVRDDLAFLVLDNAERSDAPVPACPQWTVRDVLGHVGGLGQDAVSGDLPAFDLLEQWRDSQVAATRDETTADQVRRSAHETIEDVVARWRHLSLPLGSMLNGAGSFQDGHPLALRRCWSPTSSSTTRTSEGRWEHCT
jgi:hypothetical protein